MSSACSRSYVIVDDATKCAAIVDPVLDFDFKAGRTTSLRADKLLACMRDEGLAVQWILETHAHADHLSGARHLQERVGGRIAIGERITDVQAAFKKLYNLERNLLPDGAQFDHLFKVTPPGSGGKSGDCRRRVPISLTRSCGRGNFV